MHTLAMTDQHRERVQAALIEWGLPREVAEEACDHRTVVSYPKGAILYLQGSSADFLFCVLSGIVGAYCPQPDGNRILFALAGPNEIVGHRAFPNSKGLLGQCFEAHARTKCDVALISRAHIIDLLGKLEAGAILDLLNQESAASSLAMLHWISFFGLNYRGRLESVLRDLARRFGVKDSRGILLIPELGHEDFAEMIDCSRPMASKLIEEMTERGQIARDGKKYILLSGFGSEALDKPESSRRPSPLQVLAGEPSHSVRVATSRPSTRLEAVDRDDGMRRMSRLSGL
jgi:CRP-like cAMP-binding protein